MPSVHAREGSCHELHVRVHGLHARPSAPRACAARRPSELGYHGAAIRDVPVSIRNVSVQLVTYQQLTGSLERKLNTWDWIDSSTNGCTLGRSHRKETQ